MAAMRLLTGGLVIGVLFVACLQVAEGMYDAEELSVGGEREDLPPGLDNAKDHSASLGESGDEDTTASNEDAKQQEHDDELEVQHEGQQTKIQENQADEDLGEGNSGDSKKKEDAAQYGKFSSNLVITSKQQTLRVGEAWDMPGLYSSDGNPSDLILGTAGGKKIYFGTARNDAWIQATTGHMWLKGSITVKNYGNFFAEKQRLRVGAVWGMPGLYASDGQNRDMIIGTAKGKKVYFGVKRQDAWIEAGKGTMWLRGSLTVKDNAHFFAEGQRLRIGAVWGMPGLYSSDHGPRDMILGTAPNKKIYFGTKRDDAWIQAGTGNMYLKGKLEANLNSHFKAAGTTLRVGNAYDMPGLYAGDGGAEDLILGTRSGRRVFFGMGDKDAYVQGGTGNMWLKGSLTSESDAFIVSQKQKLKIGAVMGMPGLWASEGESRDLMLGTAKGRKIHLGQGKDEATIEAGTGNAFFKGVVTVKNSVSVQEDGQHLRVGAYNGLPGLVSKNADLMLGAPKDKKIYFGFSTDEAYISEGSLWLKKSLETHDNIVVYSEKQRLRVGSVDGIPGIYSSDGTARDLMLGTQENKKIYFGHKRDDAWIQAGTGVSYFKGSMTVADAVVVKSKGQVLRIGEAYQMPGIYAGDETGAQDLMLGTASQKKVHFGMRDSAWVQSGTGDAYFKGKLSAGAVVADGALTVKKEAFFDDTVTVKKNLILQTATESMDLAEEMAAMREERNELKAMVAELRSQVAMLMDRR